MILDEAVLRRIVGGPEVMREQMHALRAATRRPNVTVRVLPFSAGGVHVDGPLTILSFSQEDPEVAYVESTGGSLHLESADHVDRVKRAYTRIADNALDEGQSAALIAAVAKEGVGLLPMATPEMLWRKASYSSGDISNCVEVCAVEVTKGSE